MGRSSNLIKGRINKAEDVTIGVIIYTLIGIIIGQIYATMYAGQNAFMFPVYALIFFLAIKTIKDYKKGKKKVNNKE